MPRRFRNGLDALSHLLDAAERGPGRTRLLAYPDYAGMESEEERQAFHRVVEDAAAAGAVTISRIRRAGPADIRFVALQDQGELARFLRRTPATEQAEVAIAELRRLAGPLPDWVAATLDEIAAGWAVRRELYPGVLPGSVDTAAKFLRILAAIDRGEHLHGWDMRTFSRRACGDSKAAEAGMARLARALRGRYGLPETSPREVLSALGIEKFPQPVLIRATLGLRDGTTVAARPYVGVPPDWAGEIMPVGAVPYVLVIENLASFNRHVREVDDAGIVVFSGGFPSRATMAAVRRLDAVLAPDVPFFHWGDTDRHGRLILDHIAAGLHRPLKPHLMEFGPEHVREQEEIDPQPPVMVEIDREVEGASP